eukprot:gene9855-13257_t
MVENSNEYPNTINFLNTIISSGGINNVADCVNALMIELLKDGFSLSKKTSNESVSVHYGNLRGKAQMHPTSGSEFITAIVMVLVCVTCAGFASGLTQGLLSLDYTEMVIKSRSGTPKEKQYANKVLPVISNHHLLLVTLMLWNASATEALPIFLDELVPSYLAIIISVTAVLFFGEIIPASILTGPKQLEIAANLVPVVFFVMIIFFPIAYPIAKLLDYLIGTEHGITYYNRVELMTMTRLLHEEGKKYGTSGGMIEEEVNIIDGALKFRDMIVEQVMTPVADAYMLSIKEKLSFKVLREIFKAGYSRIPVYDRDINDVVGLILAKDLIFIDGEDETPVSEFISLFSRHPCFVWHDQRLGETLTLFKKERGHMAIVRDIEENGPGDSIYKVVGIITLEDIIEEILGAEIEDEYDDNNENDLFNLQATRDIDFIRLKLLKSNSFVAKQILPSEELAIISQYLYNNIPQIKSISENDESKVLELVCKSTILTMKKKSYNTNNERGYTAEHEDHIYKMGKISNLCTVILDGEVNITNNTSSHILGRLTVLGADSLIIPDGEYVADFNAVIVSPTVQFLRINVPNNNDVYKDNRNGDKEENNDNKYYPVLSSPHHTSARKKHRKSSHNDLTLKHMLSKSAIEFVITNGSNKEELIT